MRDGLYRVQFRTPLGAGTGVVVLHGDKVSGGDAGMYYTGIYTDNNGELDIKVRIGRHSATPGSSSVFGIDNANLTLRGTANGDTAQMTGTAAEARNVGFQAVLTRIAD
jgi:hypothetical protein